MKLKYLIYEDFINYKKPSMFLGASFCTFKCEKECGLKMCQNSELIKNRTIEISNSNLVQKYIDNPITTSVVIGGLEPIDTFEDTINFIDEFRKRCNDDIVIYTGYKEWEIVDKIDSLKQYQNIIVKFGRYVPNQDGHIDEVLGVRLASSNQYAKKIS